MLAALALAFAAHVGDPQVHRVNFTTNAYAAWSPDGKWIVYQSNASGSYDIYRLSTESARPSLLISSPADDITPLYSPDGSRIAFVSERDGNREVYLADADGSNPVNISNHRSQDIHPAFSPDGTRIIFSSNRGNADPDDYDIYTMKLDGSDLVQVTGGPEVDTYASWSPDGRHIVTRRVIDGNSEVFLLDADGSNPVNLSNAPTYDGWPVWFPDGKRIAFAGGQPGGEVHIFFINPDGSNREQFTDLAGAEDRHPAISPNGQWIAFTRYRSGPAESSDIVLARTNRG